MDMRNVPDNDFAARVIRKLQRENREEINKTLCEPEEEAEEAREIRLNRVVTLEKLSVVIAGKLANLR